MGIREALNKNPLVAAGAVVGAVLLMMGIIWFMSGSSGARQGRNQKAFFTNDDGKSWFADSASKIPPFEKDGKEAVLAYVYSCDGTAFVAYMKRFTPEAKQKLQRGSSDAPTGANTVQFAGIEVKAPGGAEWYKQTDERALALMQPKCKGNLKKLEP